KRMINNTTTGMDIWSNSCPSDAGGTVFLSLKRSITAHKAPSSPILRRLSEGKGDSRVQKIGLFCRPLRALTQELDWLHSPSNHQRARKSTPLYVSVNVLVKQ